MDSKSMLPPHQESPKADFIRTCLKYFDGNLSAAELQLFERALNADEEKRDIFVAVSKQTALLGEVASQCISLPARFAGDDRERVGDVDPAAERKLPAHSRLGRTPSGNAPITMRNRTANGLLQLTSVFASPMVMRAGLRQVARTMSPAVGMLYFHPWEFDPGQPRLPLGRVARWRTYVGVKRTTRRLAALLAAYPFRRAIDVVRELRAVGDRLPRFRVYE